MRLTHVQVTNFRCVDDSTEFKVGDVTCLVGKNESGKTSVLQALERLFPALSTKSKYDKLQEYPRRHWADYKERHPNGEAVVLTTKWQIEDPDIHGMEKLFGPGCLDNREVKISKRYEQTNSHWTVALNEKKVSRFLAKKSGLTDSAPETVAELAKVLTAIESPTPEHAVVSKFIAGFRDGDVSLAVIDFLTSCCPKFLYFSNYSRMSGDVSINKLIQDQANKTVDSGDALFLQFLEYAGTTLEELRDAKKFEELRARIESASNKITDRVFEYWSQNQYLAIEVTVDSGRPGDPAPFNDGTVVRARVRNDLHKVTVPFSDRSAGFVWFFSFLVAFAQVQKQYGNVIILLDEPGHGLHGKAQGDLLRFIDEKLKPQHQVIYSTHSPFMVPPEQLDIVRLVEDRIEIREGSARPIVHGTKVSSDFLSRDADTVFPLQAALGYEITQTLFVGKNTLLVEGPSDILYLQAASGALKAQGRPGLDVRWTISPSGGVDKIWPFVSLFSGKHLNIAVLTDFAQGIKKNIERLKNSTLLKEGHVVTVAEYAGKEEADIEDLFEPAIWLRIVNEAYGLKGKDALADKQFTGKGRVLEITGAHFNVLKAQTPEFDHFTPASFLFSHPEILADKSKEAQTSLDRFQTVFDRINEMLPATSKSA